jgi:hypothetical protein
VGLVPKLGAGVVVGQDLQEVRVKGSEVAGDHVVEWHEWPRWVQQQQRCRLHSSVDDNMVPEILAARTEMPDFLVHFCSCWTLACTVVWTVWPTRISALTMSRDQLSLYRWETLFTSIPSPECTGRKEPPWGWLSQDLRYLLVRASKSPRSVLVRSWIEKMKQLAGRKYSLQILAYKFNWPSFSCLLFFCWNLTAYWGIWGKPPNLGKTRFVWDRRCICFLGI